jgi:hypothetical protein
MTSLPKKQSFSLKQPPKACPPKSQGKKSNPQQLPPSQPQPSRIASKKKEQIKAKKKEEPKVDDEKIIEMLSCFLFKTGKLDVEDEYTGDPFSLQDFLLLINIIDIKANTQDILIEKGVSMSFLLSSSGKLIDCDASKFDHIIVTFNQENLPKQNLVLHLKKEISSFLSRIKFNSYFVQGHGGSWKRKESVDLIRSRFPPLQVTLDNLDRIACYSILLYSKPGSYLELHRSMKQKIVAKDMITFDIYRFIYSKRFLSRLSLCHRNKEERKIAELFITFSLALNVSLDSFFLSFLSISRLKAKFGDFRGNQVGDYIITAKTNRGNDSTWIYDYVSMTRTRYDEDGKAKEEEKFKMNQVETESFLEKTIMYVII